MTLAEGKGPDAGASREAGLTADMRADLRRIVELWMLANVPALAAPALTEGLTTAICWDFLVPWLRSTRQSSGARFSDHPWPLADVLTKLADATDHLLREHDCDGHGYEEVAACRDRAREIVTELGVSRPAGEADRAVDAIMAHDAACESHPRGMTGYQYQCNCTRDARIRAALLRVSSPEPKEARNEKHVVTCDEFGEDRSREWKCSCGKSGSGWPLACPAARPTREAVVSPSEGSGERKT